MQLVSQVASERVITKSEGAVAPVNTVPSEAMPPFT